MTYEYQSRSNVLRAIESSCIPILCGNERRVYATARRLFRTYGITSYALIPKHHRNAGFFSRLLASPLVKIIPTSGRTPDFLSDTIVHFFESMESSTVLPVLIDCTDDAVLLSDTERKARLEAHCFVSDASHVSEIPPFCYLEKRGTARDE